MDWLTILVGVVQKLLADHKQAHVYQPLVVTAIQHSRNQPEHAVKLVQTGVQAINDKLARDGSQSKVEPKDDAELKDTIAKAIETTDAIYTGVLTMQRNA